MEARRPPCAPCSEWGIQAPFLSWLEGRALPPCVATRSLCVCTVSPFCSSCLWIGPPALSAHWGVHDPASVCSLPVGVLTSEDPRIGAFTQVVSPPRNPSRGSLALSPSRVAVPTLPLPLTPPRVRCCLALSPLLLFLLSLLPATTLGVTLPLVCGRPSPCPLGLEAVDEPPFLCHLASMPRSWCHWPREGQPDPFCGHWVLGSPCVTPEVEQKLCCPQPCPGL